MGKQLVLVTGGSGFLGSWCIVKLLQAGYRVRTTVRSLKREGDVRAMVKAGGAVAGARYLFFSTRASQHSTRTMSSMLRSLPNRDAARLVKPLAAMITLRLAGEAQQPPARLMADVCFARDCICGHSLRLMCFVMNATHRRADHSFIRQDDALLPLSGIAHALLTPARARRYRLSLARMLNACLVGRRRGLGRRGGRPFLRQGLVRGGCRLQLRSARGVTFPDHRAEKRE